MPHCTKKKTTLLDVAEALVGRSCGADTVRTILKSWRGMRTLASLFAEANDDGILIAEKCTFNPNRDTECTGGAL